MTPRPNILPSFSICRASVAWSSLNRFETTGFITPLFASETNSIKSLKLPVYDPINLYALVGIVTKPSRNSPPKSPTSTDSSPSSEDLHISFHSL